MKKKQFKPLNIRSTELLNRSRVISPTSVNETHRKALNVINSGNNNNIFIEPRLEDVQTMFGIPETMGNPDATAQAANDEAISACHSLILHTMRVLGDNVYPQFLGYGYLTALTQNPLIRTGVEMIASEMTEKGWKLTTEKEESREKIKFLESELNRLNVKDMFYKAICNNGYMGGCLVGMDYEGEKPDDLVNAIPLTADGLLGKKIKGLRLLEAFNISPGEYNSTNPMSHNYYNPQTWFVMGVPIHRSRVLYFSQNELPTLLKPAYNFFGIPLAQTVLDVVSHFTECREAEARLLTKFSLTIFKTNLNAQILSGADWASIDRRLNHFAKNRNNDGVLLIDKEEEEVDVKITALSGVREIVSQAMEFVAAMFQEPATKLWGIAPQGMNATGESDLENHYKHISSQQERQLRKPLERLVKILQLIEYGEIDESISVEFNPLSEKSEEAMATLRRTQAETDNLYIAMGALAPEEVREELKTRDNSPYNHFMTNFDVEDTEEPSADYSEIMELLKPDKPAADSSLVADADPPDGKRWVTINGAHVLIDEDGNVEAGAEGKLSEPKVPAGEIDDLDPYEIQPLNAITDQSKYEKMVEDMETEGYKGAPIVAMENGNEGYIALTGSHRIYAARKAGIDIPVVVIPQTEETVRILDDRDDGDRAMTAEELFDDNHISKAAYELLDYEARK